LGIASSVALILHIAAANICTVYGITLLETKLFTFTYGYNFIVLKVVVQDTVSGRQNVNAEGPLSISECLKTLKTFTNCSIILNYVMFVLKV
jgi:hypothetical protein